MGDEEAITTASSESPLRSRPWRTERSKFVGDAAYKGHCGGLREFIHQTLCEKENLLADQFTMTEVRLTRQNEPCELQFSLRGPRNVVLGAIWAADRNVVYLYDARGMRYAKLRLTSLVVLKEHASAA
jgi:hypothetical protein